MSEILRRLRGRTGRFARSDKGPVTSSNGSEALPLASDGEAVALILGSLASANG